MNFINQSIFSFHTLTKFSLILPMHNTGVILRNLLRDLLRDFLWDFLFVPERVLVAKHRQSFVDLRSQRTRSAPMLVFNKVFQSCYRVVVHCGACELPKAFPCGHRCTVGLDRDPPVCLHAQGGIEAKRQPFCGWCCLEVMDVVGEMCCREHPVRCST